MFFVIDKLYYTPGPWVEGDVSEWEAHFPVHSAYELALSKKTGRPVFKNPSKALNQAKVDFSDAIKALRREYFLLPLTKYTYVKYGLYGWQLDTDDRVSVIQGVKLSGFIDIYENSFE